MKYFVGNIDVEFVYRPVIKTELQKRNQISLYQNLIYTVTVYTTEDSVEDIRLGDIKANTYTKDPEGNLTKLSMLSDSFLLYGANPTTLDEEFPKREYEWRVIQRKRVNRQDKKMQYQAAVRGRQKKWYWTGDKYYNDKIVLGGF